MPKTWQTENPEQNKKVAEEILASVTQKIILFEGEMGSGKTTLIKALCAELGVKENTSSPTFAIVHVYEGNEVIFHFDLFRIQNIRELIDLGFAEYLDSGNYIFIEWPKVAMPLLEAYNCAKVFLTAQSNTKRNIILEA